MATPSSATDIVITDAYVYPSSFPVGSRIFVKENVKTTLPSGLVFNQNCTFILGSNSDVTIEAASSVTFRDNCGFIMQSGSQFTTGDGSTLSFGAGCKVDLSQGLVYLGSYYIPENRAILKLGKDTLLKAGYQIPITGTGIIQAPEFNPSPKVTIQDYAVFEAPAIQIFDEEIQIRGNWHMDRAYPQWFAPENCTNWADPIHKAIAMKRTGEVFLQRGLYKVQSSIHIPYGIQLVGETGRRGFDYTNNKYEDTHGAIIAASLMSDLPDQDSWRYFDFGSMILVNFNPNKIPNFYNNKQPSNMRNEGDLWDRAYPVATCTALRHIGLSNGAKVITNGGLDKNNEVVPELTAVFVAGGCVFEDLTFGAFKQAIVKTADYADNMQIFDCAFSKSYEFNNYPALLNGSTEIEDENDSQAALYMVQLNGSGDNLIFRGNAFHGDSHYDYDYKNNTSIGFYYNYALSVRNCFGGTIDDNIINSRVRISNCRGLTFSNNHMESDNYDRYHIQLRIIDSQITVSSNFFYKSDKNNIVVRGAKSGQVCSSILENNTFYCRFSEIPKSSSETDVLYKRRYDEYIERWKKRSAAAEICINPGSSVQLRNQFRQMNGVNYMTWPTSVGIRFKLVTPDGDEYSSNNSWITVLNRLNTLSPYLSSQGNIKVGCKVENLLNTQSNININLDAPYTNENIRWYSKTGYYDYYAQIVFDKERSIIGTINGVLNAHLITSPIEHLSYCDCVINGNVSDSQGTLFPLSTTGWNATLYVYRSYRKTLDSPIDHWDKVAIPVCGVESLYDNGITLSGYLWEKIDTDNNRPEFIYNNLSGITAVTFRNSNVECLSTVKPSSSNLTSWQQGDIIYNIGENESWDVFIKK